LATKCKDENEYIKAMTCKMSTKFQKHWGECNLLMSIAVVLDPRNKMTMIRFCFPIIYQELEATANVDRILSVLNEFYVEYVQ
jgi:hypothetical protein